MMDRVTDTSSSLNNQITWNAPPKKVLTYRIDERMGGKVPVWDEPTSAKEKVSENLSQALLNEPQEESFKTALARVNDNPTQEQKDQEFGFGDVIDMVNPLQHIPLVSHAYRGLTGDDIKPASRILGGALFGGPLGAASGLVNVIAVQETGKDMTGHALSSFQSSPSRAPASAKKPYIIRMTENVSETQNKDSITTLKMKEMPRIIRLPRS